MVSKVIAAANVRPACVVMLGILMFTAVTCVVAVAKYDWSDTVSWDDLQQLHDISYPQNATDLVYSIGQYRNFWVRLAFKAPPENALAFANRFCDGIFHQGYDPFNAIDTFQPSSGAYLIKVWPGYYSYSPNVPKTYFGNRCSDRLGFDIQIVIDKTIPNLYAVKFDLPRSCGDSARKIPCYSHYSMHPAPIRNFNMLNVTGIEKSTDDEWIFSGNEMCLETHNLFQDSYKQYVGSIVDISIDGHAMPRGYITQSQTLVPYTDINNDGTSKHGGTFNYCLNPDWSSGLHIMNVQVTTKAGTKHQYSWKFRVDYLWL